LFNSDFTGNEKASEMRGLAMGKKWGTIIFLWLRNIALTYVICSFSHYSSENQFVWFSNRITKKIVVGIVSVRMCFLQRLLFYWWESIEVGRRSSEMTIQIAKNYK
jgi:hypothetical protein